MSRAANYGLQQLIRALADVYKCIHVRKRLLSSVDEPQEAVQYFAF
jgi:hypothetical protein